MNSRIFNIAKLRWRINLLDDFKRASIYDSSEIKESKKCGQVVLKRHQKKFAKKKSRARLKIIKED